MNERAGHGIPQVFRLDLLVDDLVVVELKVVLAFTDAHKAQILSYLRFSNRPIGLLLNFGAYPWPDMASGASSSDAGLLP